jgi:hypothetical protein
MAKFEHTPQWKRQMTWDPETGQLRPPDRPPTRKQLDYLRALCAKRGVDYVLPATRRAASSRIDQLRKRRSR